MIYLIISCVFYCLTNYLQNLMVYYTHKPVIYVRLGGDTFSLLCLWCPMTKGKGPTFNSVGVCGENTIHPRSKFQVYNSVFISCLP